MIDAPIVLVKCCKCQRIKVNGNWLPEPRFLSSRTSYSHAYCPICLDKEMAVAEKYASERLAFGMNLPVGQAEAIAH